MKVAGGPIPIPPLGVPGHPAQSLRVSLASVRVRDQVEASLRGGSDADPSSLLSPLQLLKKMSSSDTPLGTVALLQEKQKAQKTPYIVLSGSGKSMNA